MLGQETEGEACKGWLYQAISAGEVAWLLQDTRSSLALYEFSSAVVSVEVPVSWVPLADMYNPLTNKIAS